MARLILRRLLLSVPLVFVVSALTFVLESLTPGDEARAILGVADYTPAQIAELRKQLGLDQPLYAQYWHWLDGVLHGSLGTSVFSGQSVSVVLNQRLAVTLSLVLGTMVVSGVIGVGLGLIGALRRGRVVGRAVDVLSVAGLALPNFWVGLVLIAVFAVAVPVFPATGYVAFGQSPDGWARSLVLPVAALAVGVVAIIAKQARDSFLDVLDRDFIWALRARGIPERTIIFRHALRAGAIPIVTLSGLVVVGLLGGTILVESVFGLPGLGSLSVQATTQHDMPVVQGVAVYFTLIVVAVNLLVDVCYGWLNPKVRAS